MDDPFISQFQDTPADGTPYEDMSDLIQMKKAYINEKAAPELLENKADLVARLQVQIQNQEDAVEATDSTSAEGSLVTAVWRLELTRARHVLRAYLRTRLQKLEADVMAILNDEAMHSRLSPRELQYAKDYFLRVAQHLRSAVLEHLPPAFASLTQQSNVSDDYDMVGAPNLDRHVFVRALEDRGAIELDPTGDDVVELNKDDLYVMRYRPVRELLRDKWVELV